MPVGGGTLVTLGLLVVLAMRCSPLTRTARPRRRQPLRRPVGPLLDERPVRADAVLAAKGRAPLGGGGSAASTSLAALADLGEGGDAASEVSARPVGQATGKAGRELPEEFKAGLDAYFNKLEAR